MSRSIERSALPRVALDGEIRGFDVPGVACHRTNTGLHLVTQRGLALAATGTDSGHFGRSMARLLKRDGGLALGPIPFLTRNGAVAHGYTAEQVTAIIARVCQLADAGRTTKHQAEMVRRCRAISYALMATALTKMIDEACGYRPTETATALPPATDEETLRRIQREEAARNFLTVDSRRAELERRVGAVAEVMDGRMPLVRRTAWARQLACTVFGVAGLELGATDEQAFWRVRHALVQLAAAFAVLPRRRVRGAAALPAPGPRLIQLALFATVPEGSTVQVLVTPPGEGGGR